MIELLCPASMVVVLMSDLLNVVTRFVLDVLRSVKLVKRIFHKPDFLECSLGRFISKEIVFALGIVHSMHGLLEQCKYTYFIRSCGQRA